MKKIDFNKTGVGRGRIKELMNKYYMFQNQGVNIRLDGNFVHKYTVYFYSRSSQRTL